MSFSPGAPPIPALSCETPAPPSTQQDTRRSAQRLADQRAGLWQYLPSRPHAAAVRGSAAPGCPPLPASWASPCSRLDGSCVPACAGCPGPAGSQPAQRPMRGRSHPGPGWLLPAFARVQSAVTVAGHRSAAGPPVGRAIGEETGDEPIAGAGVPASTKSTPAQSAVLRRSGEPQMGWPGKRSTGNRRTAKE